MARESVDPKSRFAAVFSAPAMHGTTFEWRDATPATPRVRVPFRPIIRIRGSVSNERAMCSPAMRFDGTNWTQLGSVTLALPSQIYVGWALSSQNAAAIANATFADQGPAAGAVWQRLPALRPRVLEPQDPIAITESCTNRRAGPTPTTSSSLKSSTPIRVPRPQRLPLVADVGIHLPANSRLDAGPFW
jgi:hypothetical protein